MLYRLPAVRREDRLLGRRFGAAPMLLGELARRFANWRLRRTTARRLHRLDDHLLADIGISRDEIEARVRHDLGRQ